MTSSERDRDDQIEDFWADDDDDESSANVSKYLFFSLGNDFYGINIMSVTEIIEMQPITEVPDMPGFIRGVINLRGKVIPVMDLRLRFGMAEREYGDRTCIIVTAIESTSLGLIVDTVADVHDVPVNEIEPAPDFSGTQTGHYIEGVTRVDERVSVLIDAHKVLRGRDLAAFAGHGADGGNDE